jgi:hypothetical protein
MDTKTMARPKKTAPQPASKPQPKAIAFRAGPEYVAWVDDLASANRSTVSGLLDQALAKYAREIGFTKPIPER